MTGRLWATQQMYTCTKLKGRVPCPMVQQAKNTMIRWAATCQTSQTPDFDAIASVLHDYTETQTKTDVPNLTLEHRFCLATLQRLGFGFSSALIVNKIENSESCIFTRTYGNENIFINNCIWTTDSTENNNNNKSRQPLSAIGLEQYYYYFYYYYYYYYYKRYR